MKKSIQHLLLISLLLLGTMRFSYAQPDLSHWQIGVNAGTFIYQGDLSPSRLGSYKTMKPDLGIYVSRILSPAIAVQAIPGHIHHTRCCLSRIFISYCALAKGQCNVTARRFSPSRSPFLTLLTCDDLEYR